MTDINWLKTGYYFSVIATLSAAITFVFSYATGDFATLIFYVYPVMIIFYPIAIVGTIVYTLKKILKEKSLFELMQMSGSGLGSLMPNNDGDDDGRDE